MEMRVSDGLHCVTDLFTNEQQTTVLPRNYRREFD